MLALSLYLPSLVVGPIEVRLSQGILILCQAIKPSRVSRVVAVYGISCFASKLSVLTIHVTVNMTNIDIESGFSSRSSS